MRYRKKNRAGDLICIFAGQFRPAGHISPTSALKSRSEYICISGNVPFSRRLILSGYRTRLWAFLTAPLLQRLAVESVQDVLYKQQGVTDFLVVEKE